MLEACEQVLRAFVVGPREGDMAALVSRLERATFLVGAVAILGFSANEDEIKSTSTAAAGGSKKKGGKSGGGGAAAAATAAGSGPLIRVPVPPAITSLLRVLLLPEIRALDEAAAGAHAYSHTQQVAAAEGGNSEGEAVPVPEQVRALAFLSLGKACLRDKALAKENVNLFVRELAVGASAAIKSNALLILGDLCVRCVSRHGSLVASSYIDRRKAQPIIIILPAHQTTGTPHWWSGTCPPWPAACRTRARSSAATRWRSSRSSCFRTTSSGAASSSTATWPSSSTATRGA